MRSMILRATAGACLVLLAAPLSAAGTAQAQQAPSVKIEKTPQDTNVTMVLLGRACRASTDADWFVVCAAAVAQAKKETDAWAALPAADKEVPAP